MPSMLRGYNAKGETKAFENSLPEGWENEPPKPKKKPKPKKED